MRDTEMQHLHASLTKLSLYFYCRIIINLEACQCGGVFFKNAVFKTFNQKHSWNL